MIYQDLREKVDYDLMLALSYLLGSVDRFNSGQGLPKVQEKRIILDAYRIQENKEGVAASYKGRDLCKLVGKGNLKGYDDLDEAECDKIYAELQSNGIVDIFEEAFKKNRVFARVLLNKYAKVGVDNKYPMARDTEFYRVIGRDLSRVPNDEETLNAIKKEVEEWKC